MRLFAKLEELMTTLYTKLSLQLSQTLAEMASVMGMGEFKQWFLGQLVPQQAFTDSLQARPSTASNQMCKTSSNASEAECSLCFA